MTTHDTTDEFDKKLELMRKQWGADSVPHTGTLDAAIYVRDTLDLAYAAARSLEKAATLDHAIAIYDRIEAERMRGADD